MSHSSRSPKTRAAGIAPSDILQTSADEIGNCLAIVRSKAVKATGDEREDLFIAYDELPPAST